MIRDEPVMIWGRFWQNREKKTYNPSSEEIKNSSASWLGNKELIVNDSSIFNGTSMVKIALKHAEIVIAHNLS